jgi:hypothetical protein
MRGGGGCGGGDEETEDVVDVFDRSSGRSGYGS